MARHDTFLLMGERHANKPSARIASSQSRLKIPNRPEDWSGVLSAVFLTHAQKLREPLPHETRAASVLFSAVAGPRF
jgi:hypothetical protein